MRETIYEWMKNLAVFYLFFTAVMNFLPDGRYHRYVRHFLGLLLILLLITPALRFFRLADVMTQNYVENSMREELRKVLRKSIFLRAMRGNWRNKSAVFWWRWRRIRK